MTRAQNKACDATVLRILDLRADGLSNQQIGLKVKMTRGQVSGLLFRIDRDTDKHDASPHLNGTMPRDWWRAGLRRRKA